MEMTLDMGKNIATDLRENASIEGVETDHFALNMIELGLRVYSASKEEKNEKAEPGLQLLLENNAMLKEITRCVFDKSKLENKVFDAKTLVTMIENNAKAYLKGQSGG